MTQIKPLTEEEFEALRQEHGELFEADTPLGLVYVRRANKHEFRRAVKKLQEKNLEAQDELCLNCAVYPSRGEMARLFDKYPALCGPIADVIGTVASGDEEARAKKPLSSGSAAKKTSE
jgi:hypothetical protein